MTYEVDDVQFLFDTISVFLAGRGDNRKHTIILWRMNDNSSRICTSFLVPMLLQVDIDARVSLSCFRGK